MTKPKMPATSKPKPGRPPHKRGRGRAMSFYVRPEVEKEIRDRAAKEDKPIGAVISEAVTGAAK